MIGFIVRKAAAEYLSAALGRRITDNGLAKHAERGTGPRYVMILGRASYREAWLDDWVAGVVQEVEKSPKRRRPLTPRATARNHTNDDNMSTPKVAA